MHLLAMRCDAMRGDGTFDSRVGKFLPSDPKVGISETSNMGLSISGLTASWWAHVGSLVGCGPCFRLNSGAGETMIRVSGFAFNCPVVKMTLKDHGTVIRLAVTR